MTPCIFFSRCRIWSSCLFEWKCICDLELSRACKCVRLDVEPVRSVKIRHHMHLQFTSSTLILDQKHRGFHHQKKIDDLVANLVYIRRQARRRSLRLDHCNTPANFPTHCKQTGRHGRMNASICYLGEAFAMIRISKCGIRPYETISSCLGCSKTRRECFKGKHVETSAQSTEYPFWSTVGLVNKYRFVPQ